MCHLWRRCGLACFLKLKLLVPIIVCILPELCAIDLNLVTPPVCLSFTSTTWRNKTLMALTFCRSICNSYLYVSAILLLWSVPILLWSHAVVLVAIDSEDTIIVSANTSYSSTVSGRPQRPEHEQKNLVQVWPSVQLALFKQNCTFEP
jgi:hypothetical protein